MKHIVLIVTISAELRVLFVLS